MIFILVDLYGISMFPNDYVTLQGSSWWTYVELLSHCDLHERICWIAMFPNGYAPLQHPCRLTYVELLCP